MPRSNGHTLVPTDDPIHHTMDLPRGESPVVRDTAGVDAHQLASSMEKLNTLTTSVGDDDDSNGMLLPTPPDGGWGWMIVFGSFMIHVLADGVAYSFGIFLVELLDYFPAVGRSEVGWIPSILIGVTWGSGEFNVWY